MSNPFINAMAFLIETIFSMAIILVLMRFLLQCVRADFYNPLSQFIVKMTNPLVLPLRKIVPGYKGLDNASLLLVFILCLCEIILFSLLGLIPHFSIFGIILLTFAKGFSNLFNFYIYAFLLLVVLSWIAPGGGHPAVRVLYQLTDPIQRPFSRLIPPIAGIDITPIFIIMALKLLDIFIVGNLQNWAF